MKVRKEHFAQETIGSTESVKLELKLANGKSRTFRSGSDMHDWYVHNSPKAEFNFDKTLSEWFESRKKKS